MPAKLMPSRLKFPSSRSIRLTDFRTGSPQLQSEHKAWLDQTLGSLRSQADFWIYIVGYASKLRRHGTSSVEQSEGFNRQLSYDRASEVAHYLEERDHRVSSRIREFAARGNADYTAPASDDSADERAVEVHINYVAAPPPVPPHVEPAPMPGGIRYGKWAVAAPFGVTVTVLPGLVAAANVVVLRCREGKGGAHAYLSPGVGGGASYSGPSISKIKDIIKNLLGTMSYSGMSFTDIDAVTPFNFRDLDGATCELRQIGAGLMVGYLKAQLSIRSQVWYRTRNGKMFGMRELVTNADVSGKDLQLGVGGSVVGGPLLRID